VGLIYFTHTLLLAPLTHTYLRTYAERVMNDAITAEDNAQEQADAQKIAWVEATARADFAGKE